MMDYWLCPANGIQSRLNGEGDKGELGLKES